MIRIASVTPTVLLRREGEGAAQLVRIALDSDGEALTVELAVESSGVARSISCRAAPGASSHTLAVPVPSAPMPARAVLVASGGTRAALDFVLSPPRPITVHVVQSSHHDVGYTSLASAVLGEQARWLSQALDMARDTDSYPPEARFRVVIEQAWSLQEFLRRSGAAEAGEMASRLRQGRFELTALFGNMVTELCGHETLYRALYPARAMARRFGVDIVSAEHNDVPGISWGLCRVLADADIRLFCPTIPHYYRWGGLDLAPHWDERAIFGRPGPGAFWWEAPSGKRVLFWCANGRAGGEGFADPESLERELGSCFEAGYPFSALRWTFSGARRDNAPFTAACCDAVRAWNREWANPRLELSTNARFLDAIAAEIPPDLPVRRGELPGQDYPVGSTSTAAATAANRATHAALPAAELLASAAALHTDFRYPERSIAAAWEEVLWHDEHTWGHHFPAGPTARASAAEKAVHAFRAEALAHDVAAKSMARIADALAKPREAGAHRLVVFNPLPRERDGIVTAALRELDNCGSEIVTEIDETTGVARRRGVLLTDRWHVNLDPAFVRGEFRLVDESSGAEVPFELVTVEDGMSPVPFAAERLGLGSGSRRYGLFENPAGVAKDIVFRATAVPGCGYRSYLLVPSPDPRPPAREASRRRPVIENERFRVEATAAGVLESVRDLATGRELLDPACPHRLLDVLVRSPREGSRERVVRPTGWRVRSGELRSVLDLEATDPAHPDIRHRIVLDRGEGRVHLATRILRSAEPLLDLFLCFPFAAEGARLCYEGTLCTVRLTEDLLPGAASDDLAVQNGVLVRSREHALLWSSLDAPVACLGALRRGAVSPAHRALFDAAEAHPPLEGEDYRHGWVYAHLYANNFGTNFAVSQSGDALFRFVLTPLAADTSVGEAVLRGQEAVVPLGSILGATWKDGSLPPARSLLRVEPPELALLAWKRAEAGAAQVVRLWNPSQRSVVSRLRIEGMRIGRAELADAVEGLTGQALPAADGAVLLEVPPDTVWTVVIPDQGLVGPSPAVP